MQITPRQRQLVQETFKKLVPQSDAAATMFYARFFELDPAMRPLFKGDMTEQGRKVLEVFSVAIVGLDTPDEVIPALKALGYRHVTYGVKLADYSTAGAALLDTLEKTLGADCTPEVYEAWKAVYQWIVDIATDGVYST